jgi:signal transduction histidine kinase
MGELIDDLLELSRVGRAELRRDRAALSTIAEGIATDLAGKEPHRSVEIKVQPGVEADADSRLIRAVLENLFDNAWKFTANVSRATIEFGSEQGDGATVFFVRDNGSGFDMRYVEKLFQPFQRLHRDADFPGTGIGLATVHRIIDRHGGRVWAEGALDKGTTIFFTLSAPTLGERP